MSQMSDIISPARKRSLLGYRRLASRKLVRPLFQVILAPGNCIRTDQCFSQPIVLVHNENHPYDEKEVESQSCQFIVRGRIFSTANSKMVTRLVRHYDQ